MSSLAVVSGEQTTEQFHTGDTNWFDAFTIPSVEWVDGQRYGMVVTAQIGGDSVADLFGMRTIHGPIPTIFPGSTHIFEPAATDAHYDYTYVHRFIHIAGEDITIQIQTANAVQTVSGDSIVVEALPLDGDLVEGTDYIYAEQDDTASPVDLSDVFADFAVAGPFTPANEGDNWLAIGCYNWLVNNLTRNAEFQIDLDGVASNLISEEGEDLDESRVYGSSRAHTLSSIAHTFTIQARDDAAIALNNQHNYSAILVIRLNKYQSHNFFWDEDGVAYSIAEVYQQIGNLSIVPLTTGRYVSIGSTSFDTQGASKRANLRIQDGGITKPTGRDDHRDTNSYDPSDRNALFTMFESSWNANETIDIDLDSRCNSIVGGPLARNRSLVVFSLELQNSFNNLPQYGQVIMQPTGPEYAQPLSETGDIFPQYAQVIKVSPKPLYGQDFLKEAQDDQYGQRIVRD